MVRIVKSTVMKEQDVGYRIVLREELAKRCERNPRYSLRSFAKSLGMDPGLLSRILNGFRPLSLKSARKVLSRLDLDPLQKEAFLQSVVLSEEKHPIQQTSTLDLELFRVIADWYHVAILELSLTQGFRPDFRWIAGQLGISSTEAKLAVERLLELGLLEKRGDSFVKTDANLSTADKHLTDSALRKHQRQILEKALDSLEEDPIEIRNHSGMAMAIDPKRIPEAKRRIEKFSQEIMEFLEGGDQTEVYQMSLCLYPLQKRKMKARKEENV